MSARAPLTTVCTRCDRPILEVRWDDQLDTIIGRPRLDPTSLDDQQIIACVIVGVDLWHIGRSKLGHHTTSQRTPWWPTEPIPGHIVPEHHCARTWHGTLLDLTPPTHHTPDTPPF